MRRKKRLSTNADNEPDRSNRPIEKDRVIAIAKETIEKVPEMKRKLLEIWPQLQG